MDKIFYAGLGAFGLFACWFGTLTVKKGGSWAIVKIKAWWTSGEKRLATIESDISIIKTKLGMTPAPAAQPANIVAGVQQSPPAS